MATDIKEYFSKFFDWNNDPQRFEVYSVLEEATKGFQRGRCEALLHDLRQLVDDWKYQELCDSIDRENKWRKKQVNDAFEAYSERDIDLFVENEDDYDPDWEELERKEKELKPLPPPFPEADTSTILTPPIFDYAFSLLSSDGEEPPKQAATPPASLPPELQTDEARRYFDRAREYGLIDEEYRWLKGKEMLACFAQEMSEKLNLGNGVTTNGRARVCWKPFEQLFGVKNLRANLNDLQKIGREPSESNLIDKVFM